MKRIISLLLIFSFPLLLIGCQSNKTRVAEGTVAGGALGALAGGLIGGGKGAGIGAAIGAAGGALIGSQIEKKPPQDAAAATQTTTADRNEAAQVSILQVVELSKQGTPDNVIIDKIKKSNSKFNLTQEDVNYLKNQGVSQKVIDAMKGSI